MLDLIARAAAWVHCTAVARADRNEFYGFGDAWTGRYYVTLSNYGPR